MTSSGSLRWTVDGASPQFLDSVVDISVMLRDMYAQCLTVLFWLLTPPVVVHVKVVDFPVMAQMTFSLVD